MSALREDLSEGRERGAWLEDDPGGFDQYDLVHRALPDLDFEAVRPMSPCLGRVLRAPFVLVCEGRYADLDTAAEIAARSGIGLLVDAAHLRPPSRSVRRTAPDEPILLQVPAHLVDDRLVARDCAELLAAWDADALVVELRPLEAAAEDASSARFSSLGRRLADLCAELGRPVLAAEGGHGLAADTVRELLAAGVAGLRVTGLGAAQDSRLPRSLGACGIRSAEYAKAAREAAPGAVLIAGGGIRDGVDAAKAIALGADVVALPEGAGRRIDEFVKELRLAMFSAGARHPGALRGARLTRAGGAAGFRSHSETLTYQTAGAGFIDITADVRAVVAHSGIAHGLVHVYSHHTTAAVRVNENEPLLLEDFERFLDGLAPRGGYEHDDMTRRVGVPPDEPVNGHSHCRHLLLGGSETLPIAGGVVDLGTWQSVFLVELDGGRLRHVTVHAMGA